MLKTSSSKIIFSPTPKTSKDESNVDSEIFPLALTTPKVADKNTSNNNMYKIDLPFIITPF